MNVHVRTCGCLDLTLRLMISSIVDSGTLAQGRGPRDVDLELVLDVWLHMQ